jgi:hypothetical protein
MPGSHFRHLTSSQAMLVTLCYKLSILRYSGLVELPV